MSYLDETGLAHFWDKIKQKFGSLLSRSANVSVYVSKTGSDSNDGLSSSTPVLTFGRALAIAQNYSTSGEIAFFFGPGEWGVVAFNGSELRCGTVRVTNFTDSTPATVADFNALSGASVPPHFTSIVFRDCTFTVGAVSATDFECFSAYNTDSNVFFSFGRLVLHESYFALINAIVIPEGTSTSYVIHLTASRLNIFGGTIYFDSIERTNFIQNASHSSIRIASNQIFSGSFTGKKFYFPSFTHIQSDSINPNAFPGTEAGTGSYHYDSFFYQGAGGNGYSVKLNGYSISDATRTSGSITRFGVFDKNDKLAGDLEVGLQTNGARYIALQGRNRADTDWFGGFRIVEASNGSIAYLVGSSPASGSNRAEVATTEWIRSLFIPQHFTASVISDITGNAAALRHKDSTHRIYITGGDNSASAHLVLNGGSAANSPGRFFLNAATSSSSKSLTGDAAGSLSWNGQPVQTASDERLKTKLSAVPDGVLDAWGKIAWGEFKFLDAVEGKGASARLHVGLVAQAVDRTFLAEGLDACRYGILCHELRSAYDAVVTVKDSEAYVDDDGVEHPAVTHEETVHEDAVDLWTARYTEALCMEAAYMRRENARLKERLAALEERLAALEMK